MKYLVFLWTTLGLVGGDIYLHNPRGSNNRLDEQGRERNNANRLFDSQNNNRGGYNVGSLYYYEGSVLSIEWTNQHSCGDPNNHCELILQYMCNDMVRDGTSTQTIPDNPLQCTNYNCNEDLRYGMHENHDYYKKCKYRKRNGGLFAADQKPGKKARNTRQNPGGTRRGYECPEERDYYPYWHPTPWIDIAILTNDVSRCAYYEEESENVKGRWECVLPEEYLKSKNYKNYEIPNNENDCKDFVYASTEGKVYKAEWRETPSHEKAAPECRETDWSRDNHLGNGLGGYPNMFNWTIPKINHEKCVLRMRYNISTGEFDGWNSSVNSSLDGKPNTDVDIGSQYGLTAQEAKDRGYVYKNNPEVSIFKEFPDKLQLRQAMNTAQYGRTFQDRSHTFAVRNRDSDLEGKTIHNVNVRGKRGNIVQVYPAVEYDFVPNTLLIKKGDYIHFQWTGSNTNPNNNDGQGRAGSDRSNVVLLKKENYREGKGDDALNRWGHFGNNYPEHLDEKTFLGLSKDDMRHLAILDNVQFGGEMSELDDAGTYYDLGPRKVTTKGVFHYMSTRNNNFSNRSQKGRLAVITYDIKNKKIGRNGGSVTIGAANQGVWVQPGAFKQLQNIELQHWTEEEGEEMIKNKNGKIDQLGNGYASGFLVVSPQGKLTQGGEKVTMKLLVDSELMSTAKVYRGHEDDLVTWTEVEADISDGVASFQSDKGGVYLARTHTRYGAVVGIVIACLILVVIVAGSVVYFRRYPGKWQQMKSSFTNAGRSVQGRV